jgi:hypothetical protein
MIYCVNRRCRTRNQFVIPDLQEGLPVIVQKFHCRIPDPLLVILEGTIASDLTAQGCRYPGLEIVPSEQDKCAIVEFQQVVPETNRKPQARVLPNPWLILIAPINEELVGTAVNPAIERGNPAQYLWRKLRQVVSFVTGLIEKAEIKVNEFLVLIRVVVFFLVCAVSGPIASLRNQTGQH